VKKGTKLYVEGELQTRKWTDNTGAEKYTTEVVLSGFGGKLVLCGAPSAGSTPSAHQEAKQDGFQPQATGSQITKDEIPFIWVGVLMMVLTAAGVA
jgi:single-strand DNA-binding protein